MRGKLLYYFVYDTLRSLFFQTLLIRLMSLKGLCFNTVNKIHGLKDLYLNTVNKVQDLKDLYLNTVNKVQDLKDLYLNIFNKNKLFFVFISLFGPSAPWERKRFWT